MLSSVFIIVSFLAGIHAANDWNTPCVKGQCSYDLPATNGPSSGTMKIWGSENAISDITEAADWKILGCDPTALSQNIHLVCMNDDPSSLCGHLEQNTGAANKIVRLPEDCGANAFARVSKSWIPDDQSIPSSIKARLFRRDGKQPVVKALAIDTNFDAVDWSKTGKVNIAIHAANVPGAATDIQVPGSRRAHRVRPRFLVYLPFFCRTAAASAVQTAAGSVESVIDAANTIDDTKTFTPDPLNFSKSSNLFNTSVDCGAASAALSVDIDATANAQPTLTLTVEGTLAPPELSTFKAVTGMTAHLTGSLTISAQLTGHVDSGPITLFSAGIPGFDFPGVLKVGPFFQVDAEFVGDVQLTMDMTVGLNFDVNNAQLTFPADDSSKPDSDAFSIEDTPLKLSASPSVQATGTLTAHLIPSLNLGIEALAGKGDATVFIKLDTSASLLLSLDASAEVSKTIGDNSTVVASVDATSVSDDADPTETAATTKRDDVATSGSFGGCVQLNAGIDIDAGAQGDFFGLFDDVAQISLFSKTFQLFKVSLIQRLHVRSE
ncbi:hypothetical protein B0H19DRAFT_968217 [Mycena capillaripes]|nr:hypothetical protein B0H19DRAFT_968217 [Mycena capillaripes]